MINAPPLPNDLLRNPPWRETTLTQPIDEAFLSIIKGSERELDEAGYYLKYGTEVNLGIMSASEARKLLNQKRSPTLWWREACREQFLEDLVLADEAPAFSVTVAEVYAALEEISVRHERHPNADSKEWLENWRLAQNFHRQAIETSESKQTILARKNFILSALHLLPQHQGGLCGLIENRFANAHYGIGWWDGKSIIELRTIPVGGGESAIENYHHTLWKLRRAIAHFGFVPLVDHALAQPHFSLWRKSDDKNIMAVDDDESIAMRKDFAIGIYDGYNRMAFGQFSHVFGKNPTNAAPFAGTSRASTIRICADNWELRLPHNGGVTHLAQDIFCISWMALSALPDGVRPDNEKSEAMRDRRGFFDALFGDRSTPWHDIEEVRRVTVVADPPRVACPFISCIEASILGENNELLAPLHAFRANSQLIKMTIGEHGTDLFSIMVNDKPFNLKSSRAWQQFFKTIRVNDDMTFDISALHPHLAAHFKGLKVGEMRRDIFMPEMDSYNSYSVMRRYAKAMNAQFFADEMHEHSDDEMVPWLQQIFGFMRERDLTFDAQEAPPYLVNLYADTIYGKPANDAPPAKTTRQLADRAVTEFLHDAMGELLINAMRYRSMGLRIMKGYEKNQPKQARCFQDYSILRSMNSFRENVLDALPHVAQYEPPKSRVFFERFAQRMRNPHELFAFDRVVNVLQRMVRLSDLLPRTNIELLVDFSIAKKDLADVLDGKGERKDFEKIYKYLRKQGQSAGTSLLRLVTAAQTDEARETQIINQFVAQAATLTKFIEEPERKTLGEKSRPSSAAEFCARYERGDNQRSWKIIARPLFAYRSTPEIERKLAARLTDYVKRAASPP